MAIIKRHTGTYDYIVVGGGTSGCVVANRLSESGEYTVLLLEAGPRDTNIWTRVPLGTGKMLTRDDIIFRYMTEPVPELNDRRLFWPRGKMLGGSSSVNGSVFVRGDASEFDHWRDLGNSGWAYKDVLPAYRKLEDYSRATTEYRGRGGPVPICELMEKDELTEAFLRACLEAGIPINSDYNGKTMEGAAYLQYNQRKGRRASTAYAYLKPVEQRPNLEVMTEAPVTRVLILGGQAVGVEYRRSDKETEVHARREVVLAAGSVDSPKILELSGIGNARPLRQLGIAINKDLPGVGENLIDHLQVRVTFQCAKAITFNDIYASRIRTAKLGLKYLLLHRGLMATPLTTAHALTRSRNDLTRPDVRIQLHHFSSADRAGYGKRDALDAYSGFLFGIFKLRPVSRGWIHIKEGSARSAPKIQPNHLSHPADIETYVDAIRLSRRISSAIPLKPYIVRETRPGNAVDSDLEITQFVRETGVTSYHPIGTCRMGVDAMAVVDPRLRVYGVPGLRVVDASIMPTMVSSNTNAPTILIGERGAEFILADARRDQQRLHWPDLPAGAHSTSDRADVR